MNEQEEFEFRFRLEQEQQQEAQAPVAQESPGMLDFLTGSPRKGHSQHPVAAVAQKGSQIAGAGVENAAMLGTGAVAQFAAPFGAAVKKANEFTQGRDSTYGEDFFGMMDRMTYEPKMSDTSRDAAGAIGEATTRYLLPLAGMVGLAPGAVAVAQTGKRAKAAKKAARPDVAGAIDDVLKPGTDADSPSLTTNRKGAQGELFPRETVTEKIGKKDNVVEPGTASQFDPFQEQTPWNPNKEQSLLSRNMELGLPEPDMPPTIRQDKRGVGTLGNENPGLVEAVRRGAPEDIRVFDEMQRQLQQGDRSPVSTTLPRGGAMIDMASDLRGEGRDPHGSLYAEQRRGNQLIEQDVAEGQRRMGEDQLARERREAALKLEDQARAQYELQKRQDQLEFDVKRQQTLDFNAAERARQEQAPIPGLDALKQDQAYAAVLEKVSNDPRILKAEERARLAEEAYIKAAADFQEGRLSKKHVERMQRDMETLQESVEWLRSNIEYEHLASVRKQQRIGAASMARSQRGAWDPAGIKDSFEKLGRGLITPLQYLDSWKGAFDSRQWDRALSGLKDPNSKSTIVMMTPREFHRIAEPRGNDVHGDRARLHQNIRTGLESQRGLLDAPTLWITKQGDIAKVTAHEGRHRMDVFRDEGVQAVPVIIEAGDGSVKWGTTDPLPSKIRPQWVGDSHVLDMPMPKSLHDGPPSQARAVRPGGPGGKQGGYIMLERNKKKALQNLANKIDAEEKLGELKPSQMTPAEVVEVAKKGNDLDQNFVQRTLNHLTKGGLYMALKTHNPVVRYTAEKIIAADRLSRADVRDIVHERLGKSMRDMSAREQAEIWAVLDAADLNQKHISLESLAAKGFNEKQIKYAEEHKKAMEYGYEMINKARRAAGKPDIDHRVAYAAMRATGDFRRIVYDKDGGNIVGIISSDLRPRLNHLQKKMEGKGLFVGEERYFGGMPRERGSANEAFMRAIEVLAEKDPRVQDFVDVLNEIRTTEVYNFLNAKTHTMHKRGVDGMSGRKSWLNAEQNAKEGMKAQLNYMEAAIKWGHLSDAARDIKQVLDNKEVKMPKAKAWSEQYLYNALGFNPSALGRSVEQAVSNAFQGVGVGYSVGRKTMATARHVTNSMLLMLNPRFWTANVVQPTVSMPGMKAMLIARGLDAGFDFGTGYSYLFDGGSTIMKLNSGGKLTPFEQQATRYARKHHVYGSDLVEHSNRPRRDALFYADATANFVTGKIESGSRQLMFHSFAHMLNENGMKVADGLFETAHNLTDIAMNNYSAVERPQVYNTLGPIGDLAVNLQSFKHNELSRIALFARHAKEHRSLRPIVAQLTTGLAFSGVMGLIAYEEADALIKFISKKMGSPTSLSNLVLQMSEGVGKMVYDKTGIDQPYAVSHGIPSMLGLDMSRSLGLTDVVPDNMAAALFPGGSKLAEMAAATYNVTGLPGSDGPSEMNFKRAGRALSPIGMQGMVDNAWFTKEQEDGTDLVVRPRDLKGQAYRNKTDKWAKNFGFTGINESVQRQKTFNVETISRDYTELRQRPLDRMRDELFARGEISEQHIQDYVKFRGNLETLEGDLNRYAIEQNLTAREVSMLRASAGSSIGAALKARDYMEMFKR